MLLERRDYLEVLWQNLPDKSEVLFIKKAADIAMVPLKGGTSWLAWTASTAQFERKCGNVLTG